MPSEGPTDAPGGSTRRRRAVQIAAAALVSAAVLALLIGQLDWERSWRAVRAARGGWLAAAIAWSAAIVVARGLRWRLIHPEVPLAIGTAAISVQTFFNRIAPMRLGELSLPILLRRHAGTDVSRPLVLLILVRIVELAVALGLIVVAAVAGGRASDGGYLAALVGLLAVIAAVLLWFQPVMQLAVRLAAAISRWTRLDRLAAVRGGLAGLGRTVSSDARLDRARRVGLLAWTVVLQGMQIAAFDAILRAFGVALDPIPLVQGAAVALAGPALPLPSVGSIGTLEASWAAGFLWVGVSLDDAILTGVATQLITLVFAAVVALPSWLYLVRRSARRTR